MSKSVVWQNELITDRQQVGGRLVEDFECLGCHRTLLHLGRTHILIRGKTAALCRGSFSVALTEESDEWNEGNPETNQTNGCKTAEAGDRTT